MAEYTAPNHGLLEEVRLSRELFPKNGSVYISHEQKPKELALDYLLQAGCPPEMCTTLFNENSEWIFPSFELDIEQATPDELLEQILRVTKPVYAVAQHSLAAINEFGYNDHGPLHIQSVANRAIGLARELGLSEEQQKIVVIAAAGHDLGNLVNRDNHSLVSPDIFERIFPSVVEHKSIWRRAKKAMQFHNSGVFNKYIHPKKGIWGFLPIEDQIPYIQNQFGIESAVVVLSDKLDVGRWRVNDKALNQGAIDQHQYSEINLHNKGINFRIGTTNLEWNIGFDPFLRRDELSRFSKLTVPSDHAESGYAVYASEGIQNRETQIADFGKSTDQFLQKHELYITILAGFMVNPQADLFIMNIYNPMRPYETLRLTFSKEDMKEQIEELKEFGVR